jgi:ABC-type lipoprotein export system ATPase subunit
VSAVVVLRGAGLRYGDGPSSVIAVHDVDLTIEPRSSLALTGPSGSGKSSLLHLIAGLEHPTSGSVEWPGLDASPHADPTRVGVVFQASSLIPTLDAEENVALPLLIAGVTPDDAATRAGDALDLLDLGWSRRMLPDALSGGQAQRVALARVLAVRPALVLADEPTGQLDSVSADHVIDTLLQVVAELGAALVISTHDSRVASRLDVELVMRDGAIVGSSVSA